MLKSTPAKALLVALAALLPACPERTAPSSDLANGDLVFQQSLSNQSEAIGLATGSRYTHMGIVYIQNGKPRVLEASSTVTLTDYEAWVARGKDGHVVVKRLRNAEEVLTPAKLEKMRAVGKTLRGRKYDLRFEWSDEKVYCSELVYKIYLRGAGVEIGTVEEFGDFPMDHPVVAKKLEERFGATIPLDEPVISPESMFQDEKLMTVLER